MDDVSNEIFKDLTAHAAEKMQEAFQLAAGQHLNGRQSAESALKIASAIIGGTVMALIPCSALDDGDLQELKDSILEAVGNAIDKGIEFGVATREGLKATEEEEV